MSGTKRETARVQTTSGWNMPQQSLVLLITTKPASSRLVGGFQSVREGWNGGVDWMEGSSEGNNSSRAQGSWRIGGATASEQWVVK